MTRIRQDGPVFAAYGLLACMFAATGTASAQAPEAAETVLHDFATPPTGFDPWPGVIRDSAGNFYGTAEGGRYGFGVVYKLDTAGNQTVLHHFTGGTDGGNPFAGVVRDAAGNLYGTTNIGGSSIAGVVYKLDPAGHETVLFYFSGGVDGGYPEAGVILDTAGNLYGTTQRGGAGSGVVFKLNIASGQETPLYTFKGFPDGVYPEAGVILDAAGTLYGTTYYGGSGGDGTVYKVDAAGRETILYSFTGGADGSYPQTALIRDAAGVLYGTCEGVVYRVDAPGHETVLYAFTGRPRWRQPLRQFNVDPRPGGQSLRDCHDGGTANLGVVYKVDTFHHETVLHNFTGAPDGGDPWAGVVRDAAGNFYGPHNEAAHRTSVRSSSWTRTGTFAVLHSFPGRPTGVFPMQANPRRGRLPLWHHFGRRRIGGRYRVQAGYRRYGDGAVHLHRRRGRAQPLRRGDRLTGRQSLWHYRPWRRSEYGNGVRGGQGGPLFALHSFTGGTDGGRPYAGVTCGSAGTLYGTTVFGGNTVACPAQSFLPAGCGVVFKLDATGHETVLHSFTGSTDGGYPDAAVIRDSADTLYGTTTNGGIDNCYLGCGWCSS